jgi:hypothetical protein
MTKSLKEECGSINRNSYEIYNRKEGGKMRFRNECKRKYYFKNKQIW